MSEYAFNRACLAAQFDSADQARAQLGELLRGMALFEAEEDTLPTLRLDANPWLLNIVEENNGRRYSIGEIASQMYGTADHDAASFFEGLITAIPSDSGLRDSVIESILGITPEGPASGVEASYEGTVASGMDGIMSALAGFILVSVRTSDLWRFDRMGFQVAGEEYYFDHIANSTHAGAIRARRRTALRDDLGTNNLWKLRNRAFPNLRFGVDVEVHLRRFSAKLFPLALKRLAELDERARRWRDLRTNEFPDGPTDITPETPQTMANYGDSRRFRGHDGVTRTFEEHMWIDKSHRIHLIRDANEKIVEIGYIGRHLPTMKYST